MIYPNSVADHQAYLIHSDRESLIIQRGNRSQTEIFKIYRLGWVPTVRQSSSIAIAAIWTGQMNSNAYFNAMAIACTNGCC